MFTESIFFYKGSYKNVFWIWAFTFFVWFKGLCYQTINIFDSISQDIGFLICIPVIFPIKNIYCIENESSSKKSTNNSSQSNKKTGWFKFGGENKNTKATKEDFNQCANFTSEMKRAGFNFFTKSATDVSKNKKRSVTASQTYVPFYGYRNNCIARALIQAEKDLMNSEKKSS